MLSNKNKVIYLDSAASALKPQSVIDAELDFLTNHYSNAGRGVCQRATYADKMVADARAAAAEFINAKPEQIVFTSGATDGLNRIPKILEVSGLLSSDSQVLVSDLDHHSARLPWEDLSRRGKCKLSLAPLDKNFNIDSSKVYEADIFIITSMSNVMGAQQDVEKLAVAARAKNPKVIIAVDASQSVVHEKVDVKKWDCDFLCFSAHKIGADTGLGVMYIKEPDHWQADKLGGGMVQSANGHEFVLMQGNDKFEAGTLPLTQLAGLKLAISKQQTAIGNNNVINYLRSELEKIEKIKMISPKDAAIVTFTVDGMHALDFGAMLGAHGICLRVGNMCSSWMHSSLGLSHSIRLSPGPWNTMEEIDEAVKIIKKIIN